MIANIIQKIENQEKIVKLQKLKQYQDLEFLELGICDGLKKDDNEYKSIISNLCRNFSC